MRTCGGTLEHCHGRSKYLLRTSDVFRNNWVVLDPSQLGDEFKVGKTGTAATMVQDASLVSVGNLTVGVEEFILFKRGDYKLIFIIVFLSVGRHK